MEFIIQKCVELGVTKIVPVDTDRAVVKLDAKEGGSEEKALVRDLRERGETVEAHDRAGESEM